MRGPRKLRMNYEFRITKEDGETCSTKRTHASRKRKAGNGKGPKGRKGMECGTQNVECGMRFSECGIDINRRDHDSIGSAQAKKRNGQTNPPRRKSNVAMGLGLALPCAAYGRRARVWFAGRNSRGDPWATIARVAWASTLARGASNCHLHGQEYLPMPPGYASFRRSRGRECTPGPPGEVRG